MSDVKNYIFLDTNIWVYCCLASQENFDKSVLTKIRKALDNDKFCLLVPQTVQAELDARLDEHLKNLRTALRKTINTLPVLEAYPTYKAKIRDELEHLVTEANNNFQKSQGEIETIFSHRNTVKLKLTGDILVAAHIRCISRRRPFRITKSKYSDEELSAARITEIQNDAVIIEEVKNFLSGKKDYKLHIANRDGDYKDSETNKLHHDIAKDFINVELYTDIQALLKLFKVEVQPKQQETEDALRTLSSLPVEDIANTQNQFIEWLQKSNPATTLGSSMAGLTATNAPFTKLATDIALNKLPALPDIAAQFDADQKARHEALMAALDPFAAIKDRISEVNSTTTSLTSSATMTTSHVADSVDKSISNMTSLSLSQGKPNKNELLDPIKGTHIGNQSGPLKDTQA